MSLEKKRFTSSLGFRGFSPSWPGESGGAVHGMTQMQIYTNAVTPTCPY